MSCDHCHETLEAFALDICIRYLLLEDISERDLFSDGQLAIAELPQEADLFSDNNSPIEYDAHCTWEAWEEDMIRYDPTERGFGQFFTYASCYWLDHFGALTVEPLPQLSSIEILCKAGFTLLRNWIQQNCRPDCAMMPRFDFDSNLYDPLGITSLWGSEAMLRHIIQNSDFNNDNYLPESAMKAADQLVRWGDISRLRVLFTDGKLGHQLQTLDFFRLLTRRWSSTTARHPNWDVAFDLVNDISDILIQQKWGNELLCTAASADCMPLIQRLISSAQHNADLQSELLRVQYPHPSANSKSTHQSIGEAVLENHIDVVEYLTRIPDIEAHLRYRNSRGENVLHLASQRCNPDMFRVLVARFEDAISQPDYLDNTPLVRVITNSATSGNRYESASILLAHSAAKLSDSHGQRELRAAVRLGDLDMCCLLVGTGNVDPLSALTWDAEGKMSLKDNIPENENAQPILQLLCSHAEVGSLDLDSMSDSSWENWGVSSVDWVYDRCNLPGYV